MKRSVRVPICGFALGLFDRIRTAKHTVDGGREASLEMIRPVSARSKLWV
jgi:hypothetical protein